MIGEVDKITCPDCLDTLSPYARSCRCGYRVRYEKLRDSRSEKEPEGDVEVWPFPDEEGEVALKKCIEFLKGDLKPMEYMTWILPLKIKAKGRKLFLLSPNAFVESWVRKRWFNCITGYLATLPEGGRGHEVILTIG